VNVQPTRRSYLVRWPASRSASAAMRTRS